MVEEARTLFISIDSTYEKGEFKIYNGLNLVCAMMGGLFVGAFGITNDKPYKDWFDYCMIAFGIVCLAFAVIGI